MSPLTIDRIKKAKGNVRIASVTQDQSINTTKFAIQIKESGSWVNVFESIDRNLCEQTVRKATSQVLLG